MITRREFLDLATKVGATLTLFPYGCTWREELPSGIRVNDTHSQLNSTLVSRIERPSSSRSLQALIRASKAEGKPVSVAGGKHSMGGQQFGTDTILIDMTSLNRVLDLDAIGGVVEVEAGIIWPELIDHLVRIQDGQGSQWGIIQKQTGADRLTIGGALASNIHGRGLRFKPIISDVESFSLVDANGDIHTCSRRENSELFRLAIGGYGLFGLIMTVKLRLTPRRKLQRVVELIDTDQILPALNHRLEAGFVYGDFQFAIDRDSEDFLKKFVFSSYVPVDFQVPISENRKKLSQEDWSRLNILAHTDPGKAFDEYSSYYLSTSGQIYWSDSHQLSTYLENYHVKLDQRLGGEEKATEMISEIYIPRNKMESLMGDLRADFREHQVDVIYGTIRVIEKDDESFLPWAKEPFFCIVFNFHVVHNEKGIAKAQADFRRLIDHALNHGGTYFLTYHRWARKDQVEACYPQFAEFLTLKRKYDPEERFQSDWYRHYRKMFAHAL